MNGIKLNEDEFERMLLSEADYSSETVYERTYEYCGLIL